MPFGTSVGAGSSLGEHSCFVAVICCSNVAPDSRVAQSVRQGTGERRASSRTVQKLEVFKQPQWIWSSPSGQQLEVFHRGAAPARFAAIPTWRRRWAVGAFGARPDAYTLRLTEAALVPYNGLCHSYKRQGSVINACAQQGTVLQRHAPPQFLPIETRSLRASRNGFM